MYIYIWSLENGTDEPVCKARIVMHREHTCGHREKRRGWDKLRE